MSIFNIYFSPTGGTKKVADIIANAWKDNISAVDMIERPFELENLTLKSDDICIFSLPSYGGRIPVVTVEHLKKLKGNGAKAILVAVYGNRAIDDTLMEMFDILKSCGFLCICGIEAVCRHSLAMEIAKTRPDERDILRLTEFVNIIKDKIEKGTIKEVDCLPGSHDYRKFGGVPVKPYTDNKKCTKCGLCAKTCPSGAISQNNPLEVDKNKCISCMHCVTICPEKAKKVSKVMSEMIKLKLKGCCSDHHEDKLYI